MAAANRNASWAASIARPGAASSCSHAVAPVVAAKLNPPPAGLPEPADSRLAALQTAVGGEVAAGSKLTVPEALAKGEPAQVSLSLPQTVLAIIQREAAKLGLGKAAKKVRPTDGAPSPGLPMWAAILPWTWAPTALISSME